MIDLNLKRPSLPHLPTTEPRTRKRKTPSTQEEIRTPQKPSQRSIATTSPQPSNDQQNKRAPTLTPSRAAVNARSPLVSSPLPLPPPPKKICGAPLPAAVVRHRQRRRRRHPPSSRAGGELPLVPAAAAVIPAPAVAVFARSGGPRGAHPHPSSSADHHIFLRSHGGVTVAVSGRFYPFPYPLPLRHGAPAGAPSDPGARGGARPAHAAAARAASSVAAAAAAYGGPGRWVRLWGPRVIIPSLTCSPPPGGPPGLGDVPVGDDPGGRVHHVRPPAPRGAAAVVVVGGGAPRGWRDARREVPVCACTGGGGRGRARRYEWTRDGNAVRKPGAERLRLTRLRLA